MSPNDTNQSTERPDVGEPPDDKAVSQSSSKPRVDARIKSAPKSFVPSSSIGASTRSQAHSPASSLPLVASSLIPTRPDHRRHSSSPFVNEIRSIRRKSAPDTRTAIDTVVSPALCDKCNLLSQLSVTWRPPSAALEQLTSACTAHLLASHNSSRPGPSPVSNLATVGGSTCTCRVPINSSALNTYNRHSTHKTILSTSSSASPTASSCLTARAHCPSQRRVSLFELPTERFNSELYERGWNRCHKLDAIAELSSRVELEDGDSSEQQSTKLNGNRNSALKPSSFTDALNKPHSSSSSSHQSHHHPKNLSQSHHQHRLGSVSFDCDAESNRFGSPSSRTNFGKSKSKNVTSKWSTNRLAFDAKFERLSKEQVARLGLAKKWSVDSRIDSKSPDLNRNARRASLMQFGSSKQLSLF